MSHERFNNNLGKLYTQQNQKLAVREPRDEQSWRPEVITKSTDIFLLFWHPQDGWILLSQDGCCCSRCHTVGGMTVSTWGKTSIRVLCPISKMRQALDSPRRTSPYRVIGETCVTCPFSNPSLTREIRSPRTC